MLCYADTCYFVYIIFTFDIMDIVRQALAEHSDGWTSDRAAHRGYTGPPPRHGVSNPLHHGKTAMRSMINGYYIRGYAYKKALFLRLPPQFYKK